MTQTTETRWCTRCGLTLPLDSAHFPRIPSKGAGFAHHCRACGEKAKRLMKQGRDYLPPEDGMVWT